MEIQAAVLRAADGAYTIEDVSLREPGPGEMRVRVVGAGMCHTDVLPRAPGMLAVPPIITGHEGSGVVDAVGPDAAAAGFAVGDHVVLSFDSCRACANCIAGHPAYCDTFFFRNLSGYDLDGTSPVTDGDGNPVAARWFGQSSFATHCIATPRNAVKVDADLPLGPSRPPATRASCRPGRCASASSWPRPRPPSRPSAPPADPLRSVFAHARRRA